MQAVNIILDGEHCSEIREQALCILANIADGDTAKQFIMSSDEVLNKLKCYLKDDDTKIQAASAYCITNLIWKDKDGCLERIGKLKEMGFAEIFTELLNSSDTQLYERAKTALEAFSF